MAVHHLPAVEQELAAAVAEQALEWFPPPAEAVEQELAALLPATDNISNNKKLAHPLAFAGQKDGLILLFHHSFFYFIKGNLLKMVIQLCKPLEIRILSL